VTEEERIELARIFVRMRDAGVPLSKIRIVIEYLAAFVRATPGGRPRWATPWG
jgi:hypothetical protein